MLKKALKISVDSAFCDRWSASKILIGGIKFHKNSWTNAAFTRQWCNQKRKSFSLAFWKSFTYTRQCFQYDSRLHIHENCPKCCITHARPVVALNSTCREVTISSLWLGILPLKSPHRLLLYSSFITISGSLRTDVNKQAIWRKIRGQRSSLGADPPSDLDTDWIWCLQWPSGLDKDRIGWLWWPRNKKETD